MTLWLPGAAAMAALIGGSAFFSGSETALFFLSPEEQRDLDKRGPGGAAAAKLLAAPDRLLSAILFWNLLINLTYFVVSVIVGGRLVAAGHPAAAGFFSVLGLAGVILFGEVLPKSVAVSAPAAVATAVALPLSVAARLVDPVGPRLEALTRALTRTFWPTLKPEQYLSARDLEKAVEAATENRAVAGPEREVLHNVLDLSEVFVEELMRPRGTYLSLSEPVTRESLGGRLPPGGFAALFAESPPAGGRGRESVPEVDRVLMLDDPAVLGAAAGADLSHAAVPLPFVPWCATAARALAVQAETGRPAVGVVNEYGETVGVITADDLVDGVLRPDASRVRRILAREPVRPRGPAADGGAETYEVEGLTTLRYLLRKLDLPEDLTGTDPVTVNGLLHEELKELPAEGDACDWHGLRLTVERADGRDVRRVRVERLPEPAPANGGRPNGRAFGGRTSDDELPARATP